MPSKTILKLMERLSEVPDPRRQCRNLRHPLVDVLAISFCAILSGAEDFFDFERYAELKEPFLRTFLSLPNGTPSHDTFRRVFEAVDPAKLQAVLMSWLTEVRQTLSLPEGEPRMIAIDGKTMRRTFDRNSGLSALHLVSAWATDAGLTLGQVAADADSNEITAIPKLLDLIDVKGSIVTIDAAGCQKEIAEKIVQKKGDYVLALKGNQPTMHQAVSDYFLNETKKPRPSRVVRRLRTNESGHGRDTKRDVWVAPIPKRGVDATEWVGMKSITMIVCETTDHATGKVRGEARYFISSLAPNVKTIARAIRSHWLIENGLHWVLDVVFREDERRLLDRQAAENFALMSRLAVTLLKGDKSRKDSIKGKRKIAGWENSYLQHLLASNQL